MIVCFKMPCRRRKIFIFSTELDIDEKFEICILSTITHKFFYFPTRLLFSEERRLEEISSANFNTKVWACLSRIIYDMNILYLFLVCLCLNVWKPCLYKDLNFLKVAFHTSTICKGLLKYVANNFKKLRHSRHELDDKRLDFTSFFTV